MDYFLEDLRKVLNLKEGFSDKHKLILIEELYHRITAISFTAQLASTMLA